MSVDVSKQPAKCKGREGVIYMTGQPISGFWRLVGNLKRREGIAKKGWDLIEPAAGTLSFRDMREMK